jgi:hypothetical protein
LEMKEAGSSKIPRAVLGHGRAQRVFEKSHAGTIRLSVRRIAARSIIASEVCTRYS